MIAVVVSVVIVIAVVTIAFDVVVSSSFFFIIEIHYSVYFLGHTSSYSPAPSISTYNSYKYIIYMHATHSLSTPQLHSRQPTKRAMDEIARTFGMCAFCKIYNRRAINKSHIMIRDENRTRRVK